MKRWSCNLTQRFGRRIGIAAQLATAHHLKSGSRGEALDCIRAHLLLKELIMQSPVCVRKVPGTMMPFVFGFMVSMSIIWLSYCTTITAASTAAPNASKGLHNAIGTCPRVVWQGTAEFDCPNDIDGKKSPISFSVPLPPMTEHQELLAACSGSVRIDVTFQRRECEQESSILKEAIHVVLWPIGSGESDNLAPLAPDTCNSEVPEGLTGTIVRDSDPSTLLVAVGVATTRISCCQSCRP